MANDNLVQAIPVANLTASGYQTTPVWLNWFNSVYRLLNKAPFISTGIIPPTSTPFKIGDLYIDLMAKKIYCAVGTVSAADWEILN